MATRGGDDGSRLGGVVAILVIYAFAIAGAILAVKDFVGVCKGEKSPLLVIGSLTMLLGFCIANPVIVGLGCLGVVAGDIHTAQMHK